MKNVAEKKCCNFIDSKVCRNCQGIGFSMSFLNLIQDMHYYKVISRNGLYVFIFIFIGLMKYFIDKFTQQKDFIDGNLVTPSDFCILLNNLPEKINVKEFQSHLKFH
jgi:hypothetical protein